MGYVLHKEAGLLFPLNVEAPWGQRQALLFGAMHCT